MFPCVFKHGPQVSQLQEATLNITIGIVRPTLQHDPVPQEGTIESFSGLENIEAYCSATVVRKGKGHQQARKMDKQKADSETLRKIAGKCGKLRKIVKNCGPQLPPAPMGHTGCMSHNNFEEAKHMQWSELHQPPDSQVGHNCILPQNTHTAFSCDWDHTTPGP